MGVRDNHTKYELETQQWQSGTGVAGAGLPFQNLQLAQTSATTMRVCGLWAAFPFLRTICGNPRASLPGGCQVGLFFPGLDQDELVYPAHDMVFDTASGN